MANASDERSMTPSVPESNGDERAMTPSVPESNGDERAMTPSVLESNGDLGEETSHPGEAQTEEELERLIDQELEDVGKEETPDEKEARLDAQQAVIDEELRKLREELEMDSASPDDMSPEYDIAARVRQLNEELAKEGPIEEKKNRKVNFPENIVSMAVPPAEYEEEKEDGKDDEGGKENEESELVNGEKGQEGPQQGVKEGWGTTENRVNGGTGEELRHDGGEIQKRLGGGSSGQEEVELVSPSPSDSLPNRTDDVDSAGKPVDVNIVTEQKSVAQPRAVVSHESMEDGPMPQDDQRDSSSNVAVDGAGSTEAGGSVRSDPNDLEVERLTLRPRVENGRMLIQSASQEWESSASKEGGEEEFVLVERGGKFFHVHVNDLSPEERHFLGLENTKSQSNTNGSQLPPVQPKPPQKPRPSTATGGGARPGVNQRPAPRRATSAKTQKEYDRQERQGASYEEPFGNAKSKYGMTPEMKEHRREQGRLKMQRMREEKEREEQERREKEEMSEAVFKAWVENKKKEISRQKKEERERKKAEHENKEERFPEEAFKAWLDRKKTQKRSEEKVKQQLTEEQRQAYFMRSREDCERAFKEWKKSKNASLRQTHSLSRAAALETKKRARSSRKSRNLAKALEVAQNYRYTEYYGYRL